MGGGSGESGTPSLQERVPPTITGKCGGTSLITDYFQAGLSESHVMGGTTYFEEQHRNGGGGGDIDRSVGLYDKQKCDEMERATEGLEQYDTRNINVIPTPSVNRSVELLPMREHEVRSMEEVVERDDTNVKKCRVRKSRCVIHNCEAKSVKTSITEWGWLLRKKIYGYKYKSISRVICTGISLDNGNSTLSTNNVPAMGGIEFRLGGAK